jgi:23S rRNA (uridine2552-2'-O)-methyltransferase
MDKVLANKGNAVFKVFDGEYSREFKEYVQKKFARINMTKPKASRKQSSELYCVCLGFIG